MFGNDRFGRSHLLTAHGKRLLRDGPQRIDVVKVHAFHFVHGRIDIAWNGDIDDEKWAIDSIGQHGTEVCRSQQWSFLRSRCNQDIDLAALLWPLIEMDGLATYVLCQLPSAII